MNENGLLYLASPAQIIALLKKSPLFAAMPDEQLAGIASASDLVRLEPGQRLFEQGDSGDAAYLILSGAMAVEVNAEGGPTKVAVVHAGELIGEIAAFSERKRNAAVLAETEAQLLRIGQDVIHDLTRRDPSCAMNIIAELGARLDGNNSSVALMSQAANALAAGEFKPEMLSSLKRGADQFGHFAAVFENMAAELTSKQQYLQEMNTAQTIQRSFLPKSIDAGDRAEQFQIAARMLPAKSVGGDFFDYFMIDPGTLGIAVGDVSGKGVPAAIFMSVTRTILRTIARQGGDPGSVVSRLNDLLAEDNSESMFVTLLFGKLDLETGQFDYANAAHEEAWVLDGAGTLDPMEAMGPAVGLFEGIDFEPASKQLAPGDAIVLGTDGITEAFCATGEMFGMERIADLMGRVYDKTADDLVAQVTAEVMSFSRGVPQSDDLTCLAVRYAGPGS